MDKMKFREAMGKFATGVTVIATNFEGEDYGMTANAFMSVSLEPMLVVISIDNRAQMLDKIQASQRFSVNILAEDQQHESMLFAGQVERDEKVSFDQLAGNPVLAGALAQVSCELVHQYVEGDHTLFIGRVLDLAVHDGNPLLFFSGKYREIAELKEHVSI